MGKAPTKPSPSTKISPRDDREHGDSYPLLAKHFESKVRTVLDHQKDDDIKVFKLIDSATLTLDDEVDMVKKLIAVVL